MKQPHALRIADAVSMIISDRVRNAAAEELRRLHEVNAELLEALKYARRMVKPSEVDIAFIDAAISHATGVQQ